MSAEASWPVLTEVEDALERWPGVILMLPADAPLDQLQIQIERRAIQMFRSNGIIPLEAAEAMARTPGELLAWHLGYSGSVEVPLDLQGYDDPIVIIVTGDECTRDEADRWLRLWSEHFRRFKGEMEKGRGLRVIWVGALVPHVFHRNYAPPEHWTTLIWREPEPAALLQTMAEELRGCLSLMTPAQQEFLIARLTDLAGGRRADLDLAVHLVNAVRGGRSAGEWLDRVDWAHAEVPHRFTAALHRVAEEPAVRHLLAHGGVVARFVQHEWDRRWPGWEELLWAHGLWSIYGRDLVGLSPLALHVAQRLGLVRERPAAPPSETALRLLGRCLFWERLLKDRLVLRLSHAHWEGLVRRALAELEPGECLEEQVQSLTLGNFLGVLSRVLPGGPVQWDFRDFSLVRNQAAHGHKVTWAQHWARLEAIEPLLVKAYVTLAE